MPAHLLFGPDGRPLRNSNRNGSGSWEGSGYDLPHVLTFGALLSGANHTYWHDRFDRAMESSRKDAVIMENDVFLMGLLQERMLSVVSKKWSIKVPNEKDPRQAFVRDHLQTAIEQIPRFQHIRMALLWAVWYGRQAIHPKWTWKWQDRVKTLSIRKWYPIQGDKIGHQHDGTPYVLGHTGEIRNLPGVEVVVTQRGHAVRLNQAWRDRFIIHSHDLRDVDFYDWQRAEAIHGIGIRSVIHWMNWLKLEYLGAICDWVERVGLGVNLWYYSASNPAAREEAMLAAREQSNRTNLVVPYFEDQKHPGLERVETPTAGADLLIRLQEKIDEYIERFVVGQEMSASGTSTGLGNEAAAEFQESTKHQITKWDAGNEDESLTGSDDDPGIVSMLQRHTFPETWPSERNPDGFRCVFCTEVEPPDHATRLEAAASAVEMGVEVKADEIRELAGLSKPGPDDEKVGGQQAMPLPGMGPMGNGDGGSPGMDGGDGDAPPDHPFEPNQPYQRRVWDTGYRDGFAAGYAGWQEQAHPRGQPQNKGQFTSGGGSGAAAKPRPQYPSGSAGDRAQQRKQSRRKKPDPASVATLDHQKKRGWAGLVRHAIGTVRDNLTWTSLKARGAALLHAAGHPRETATRAREVATARLSALRQRYGTAGAAAIGGAYVGYYVLASTVNPSLLLIPVPLTATLITSAEAIRYVGTKTKAALGYDEDGLPILYSDHWKQQPRVPAGSPSGGEWGHLGTPTATGQAAPQGTPQQPTAASAPAGSPPGQAPTTTSGQQPSANAQQPSPNPPATAQAAVAQLRAAMDEESVQSLLGAQGNTTIDPPEVYDPTPYEPKIKGNGFTVKVSGQGYDLKRFIGVDSAGRKFIINQEFFAKQTGTGLGSQVFADQVKAASEQGFSYLATSAAGPPTRPTLNGYYTWARMGYDQTLDSLAIFHRETVVRIREQFPGAKSVQDVMSSPGGAAWWKANGVAMYNACFDLTEGSRSRKILDAYMAERARRGI